ncbi:helix-turn-helix domain-containing protein [Nesterenkonia lutea]
MAPVRSASHSKRYLSEDERIAIADALKSGVAVRAIARSLGRSPSTISREIRRNRHVRTGYRRQARPPTDWPRLDLSPRGADRGDG